MSTFSFLRSLSQSFVTVLLPNSWYIYQAAISCIVLPTCVSYGAILSSFLLSDLFTLRPLVSMQLLCLCPLRISAFYATVQLGSFTKRKSVYLKINVSVYQVGKHHPYCSYRDPKIALNMSVKLLKVIHDSCQPTLLGSDICTRQSVKSANSGH